MKMLRVYLFVVVVVFIQTVIGDEFPSDIEKCKYSESDCYVKIMNDIFLNKYSGYPGLNLPVLDPLAIDKMQISQGGDSPINIVMDFKEIVLTGVSKANAYKATGFTRNMEGGKITLKIKVPALSLMGPYKINGKVLILPIQGIGQSNLTMTGMDVTLKFITKSIVKEGKSYMQVDRSKVTFEAERLYMNLSNLFNGDKALGDNMNLFLNDNWSDILKELKPSVTAAFAEVFIKILNGAFQNIPYNEMFSN